MRKEYRGGAPKTNLTAQLLAGTTTGGTFSVVDATGYPTGVQYPFTIVLGRGTDKEEKILCSSRTGNTFTILVRGYDETGVYTHAATSTTVHHILDSVAISEMARAANPQEGLLANIPVADGTQGVYRTTDGNGTFIDIDAEWHRLAMHNVDAGNIQRVIYDNGAYPARPASATYVEWVGPVQPDDLESIAGDTWVDTTA